MSEQDISPESVRVFISYSHDSPEHQQRVLALAERLRKEGVDVHIDQYVAGTPGKGWPRWMEDQLDRAQFVLVVCTEIYRQRFLGREEPDKGKGVDWEASLITLELYHTRSDTSKFVPVLFDPANKRFIPAQLSGHTPYVLNSEENYVKLYAFLTGQAGVVPSILGKLKTLTRGAVEPLTFDGRGEKSPSTGKLDEVLDRVARKPASGTGLPPRENKIPPSEEEASNQKRRKETGFYTVVALISFLCGVSILGLMIWKADILDRLGLTGNLFYVALLPMGLAAAAFVFGVLRSYARYSGKELGGMLELGGPIVAFLLPLILILAFKPPSIANEVKIGDQIFLRSWDGSYVIAASGVRSNWPRLGKIGKVPPVPLTLLGTEQVRNGSTVGIQSLEQHLNGENVLGVDDRRQCYYQKLASDDARQEWRIVKLERPSDPVLRYGDKIYLENVYYANKRLTQDPERGDYLTIDEGVDWWWILEKS